MAWGACRQLPGDSGTPGWVAVGASWAPSRTGVLEDNRPFRHIVIRAKGCRVATRQRIRNRVPEPRAPEPNDTSKAAPIRSTATVAELVTHWLETRDKRTRQGDAQRLRDHVLPLLGARRVRDIRSEDVVNVVRHVQGKKGMNLKSAKNAYAVFAELLGAALEQGLLSTDPRDLPPDIWPVEAQLPRPTFSPAEVLALTSDPRLDEELRIYNSLAFGTGLAARWLCELRFADWPDRAGASVSPELESRLAEWKERGFARVYGRPPSAGDWLVPRRSDVTQPHTEGSVYKAFRRCCVTLGIKTRSPNAIRGTFEQASDGQRGDPAP